MLSLAEIYAYWKLFRLLGILQISEIIFIMHIK
jgi:hypothetical protein